MQEKPLSSVNEQYNSFRQETQKSGFLDSYYVSNFDQPPMKPKEGKSSQPFQNTQDYLASIELKYEKQYKKEKKEESQIYGQSNAKRRGYQSSSDEQVYSGDEQQKNQNYMKVRTPSEVPKKFQQLTPKGVQAAPQLRVNDVQEFNFPQNLTLSKGISERIPQSVDPSFIDQQPNIIFDQMQKEYDSRIQRSQNQFLQQPPPLSMAGLSQTSNLTKNKFFDLAQNIKTSLPMNHKGRNRLVAQLYSECMNKKIPESQWNFWIREQLEL